jgi:hypothetical protein
MMPRVLAGEFQIRTILSAIIVLGLSLVAAPSFAADNRNVSVINETGYAIKFLGFNSPDDALDEWENELDKTLKNQDTAYVEFDEDCVCNIKVDWANYDESVLWKNVICASSTSSGCATIPGPRRRHSSRSSGSVGDAGKVACGLARLACNRCTIAYKIVLPQPAP